MVTHVRRIYSLFELIGDLGGITEVVMLCFGFFLYSVSEHSFVLKAVKKLFKARTKDPNLFKRKKTETTKQLHQKDKSKHLDNDLPVELKREIDKNRDIRISLGQSLKLYF